jgi:hypothetical protein
MASDYLALYETLASRYPRAPLVEPRAGAWVPADGLSAPPLGFVAADETTPENRKEDGDGGLRSLRQ